MQFFIVFACVVGFCNAGCAVVKSVDDDVGLLVKETYSVDNKIFLKPEASFNAINISLFSRNIPIMRETFVPLKWNTVATKVLYSNTLNKCSIGVTVNDEKQFVVVTRCGSGLGFIHQDSVMRVRVSGGAQISFLCDPQVYEFPTPMVPVMETPQSVPTMITVFSIFMICVVLALIYLKVKLDRIQRFNEFRTPLPARLGAVVPTVQNRYNEELAADSV